MKAPVAILGGKGQLAHDLARTFADSELEGPLFTIPREELDVTDRGAVLAKLRELRPRLVVNTAAYNLVDLAETTGRDEAFRVNRDAVEHLAEACNELGATLAHYSTDFVFSGRRSRPWSESDPATPSSAYGLSKLEGESRARLCPRHFVFRVCGLYGVAGRRAVRPNFVERMLQLAAEGKKLKIVRDLVLTPSYTVDVASKTWEILRAAEPAGRFGAYHVTNYGSCSWFEFAEAIFKLAGVKADLEPTTTAEFNAPARRPAYSVLAHDGIKALGLSDLPHWEDALSRYLKERAP